MLILFFLYEHILKKPQTINLEFYIVKAELREEGLKFGSKFE